MTVNDTRSTHAKLDRHCRASAAADFTVALPFVLLILRSASFPDSSVRLPEAEEEALFLTRTDESLTPLLMSPAIDVVALSDAGKRQKSAGMPSRPGNLLSVAET